MTPQGNRVVPVRTLGPIRDATSYIPTLDGWRAVAILLVLWHHLGKAVYLNGPDHYWIDSQTRLGTIGVPIFFGLSGFLITALLLQEFQSRYRISLKSFYIRRCFRILPPLLVFLIALELLGLVLTRLEFVSSLLFFRNYAAAVSGGLFTFHLWSLSVEEHFYFLWPTILCVLLRRGNPLTPTVLIAVGFGVWEVIDFHFHFLHRLAPMLDTPMRTDLRLAGLIWGCAAGIIFQNVGFRGIAARYLTWPVFGLAFLLLACSQVVALRLATVWGAALIPILIFGTAAHPDWKLSTVLEWRLLRWIGRISYSLYLWQQLFLVPRWDAHPFPLIQSLPFSILLPFACAAASHAWIEQPTIRIGRRLAQRLAIKPAGLRSQTAGTVEAA
ncbi:MAG TPA: acyltransferase [Bryobacteraceae bacterium]|jgi:peptidoglycan/LPS O-acetylase OafA/YrhL|nr:acyltransferase [Bryobacteraceae bacterium]